LGSAKNVANDPRSFTGHRPHAFFVVHLILSLVSIALGTVIGWLGWKGMRASASQPAASVADRRASSSTSPSESADS